MKNGGLVLAAIAAGAYLTRDSWLSTVESDFGTPPGTGATGATGNNPNAPTTSTANQPITSAIPGAVPLGGDGCFQYVTGTDGSLVINCPPGVSPPATTTPSNCASGFTLDAAGVCTKYPDALLLANLNTIPWTGLADIPNEQINRIDPQILNMYSTTTGVNSGTALAYVLGLGTTAPADGTMEQGNDLNIYKALGGVYYRQGTATSSTVNGVGRIGRLGSAPAISAALPITNATLIMASASPEIAKITGRDQRAMLTAAQWNAYYTQATGIVQGIPLHPADDPQALMSAEQYQARRMGAGLQTAAPRLGLIRNARRGAFPLGGIRMGFINQWVPPGNRTIYQLPGRGAVPAGRGGKIPPRKLGLIENGGGNHRWARSPFPRPSWWREPE